MSPSINDLLKSLSIIFILILVNIEVSILFFKDLIWDRSIYNCYYFFKLKKKKH